MKSCPRCGILSPADGQLCDCGHNFDTGRQVKPIPGRSNATHAGLAPLGDRLVAQVIDALIAVAVLLSSLPFARLSELVPAVSFGLALLYLLLADGLPRGQSLGKRVMKISAVDSRSGAPCTFIQSVVRNGVGLLGLLDWLFILAPDRKRLGDLIAGTKVIRQGALA